MKKKIAGYVNKNIQMFFPVSNDGKKEKITK